MMRPRFYLMLIFCMLPVYAKAQDINLQDSVPQKPDLSDVSAIEMPPMDPYTLTFVPPMPEGAQNIRSKTDCEKAGGQWIKSKLDILNAPPAYAQFLDESFKDHTPAYGCQIDRANTGLWLKSQSKAENFKDETVTGFAWFVNGKAEGWIVNLAAPGQQASRLSQYKKGLLHGTTFTWDTSGILRSVETYENGILNGTYEKYQECLPTVLGSYTQGKPSGTWELSEEPGMIHQKVYYSRKALPAELPDNTPENTEAYWSEWFNGDGVKIAEGYSVAGNPTQTAKKIGKIQFYSAKGKPWITVQYDGHGNIADQDTFKRCTPDDNPNAPIPAYIDYDHENLEISCKNYASEVYRKIQFYQTGELWKTINMVNDTPEGLIHEYHPTGELLAAYQMKSGIPEGTISFLDKTGNPMDIPNTIRSGNGLFKALWHNGNPREEGRYVNGKKEGRWTTWFDSGSKQSETDYSGGKKNGLYKEWYLNGVTAVQIHYLNEARHGEISFYYPDGRIAATYQFANDKLKDTAYEYTHSGSVAKETDYNGFMQFDQKQYFNDGSLQAAGKIIPGFGDGTRTGKWKYYLKNTNTVWYSAEYDYGSITTDAGLICETSSGKFIIDSNNREVGCQLCAVNRKAPLTPTKVREGMWEWFNENGKLEKRGAIHLGHLNGNWEYYYPNGNPMLNGSYDIDQKVGTWKGYFSSGAPKFQGRYDKGVEQGEWLTFHESTQKTESKGQFIDGKRHGQWIWYHSNGAIREQGTFDKGKETGTWTQFYENGAKNGEGAYIDGKRDGTWTWWREDGTVWRKAQYAKGKEIKTP